MYTPAVAAATASATNPDYAQVMTGIRSGNKASCDEFYRIFRRHYACAYIAVRLDPQDTPDARHDTFCDALKAIRENRIDNADSLMAYVYTIARRVVGLYIEQAVARRTRDVSIDDGYPVDGSWNPSGQGYRRFNSRATPEETLEYYCNKQTPETLLLAKETQSLVRRALAQLRPIDREVLTRFFCSDQPAYRALHDVQEAMCLDTRALIQLKYRAQRKFAKALNSLMDSRVAA